MKRSYLTKIFLLLILLSACKSNKVLDHSGTFINIQDFGANGDSSRHDVKAILDAFEYVKKQGGGTIFFPAGTYLVEGPNNIKDIHNIRIIGEDKKSTILKRANQLGWFGFEYSSNIEIRNLTFNASKNIKYGGISFLESNNIIVQNCEFINEGNHDSEFDVYSIVTRQGSPQCKNIQVDSCNISGLQLEIGAAQNVRISNNTIDYGVTTAGIAIGTNTSNKDIKNYLIENNIITNSYGAGIWIAQDKSDQKNVSFSNIAIKENTLNWTKGVGRAIFIGTVKSNAEKHSFKNILFENNRSTLSGNAVSSGEHMFFLPDKMNQIVFDSLIIRDNTLSLDNTGVGISLRNVQNSIIIDNQMEACKVGIALSLETKDNKLKDNRFRSVEHKIMESKLAKNHNNEIQQN